MRKYVDLVVKNDISQLIISGSPEPEQLERAKLEIISQCQEICPNPLSNQHLRIAKKMEAIYTKIVRVSSIIACLRQCYDPVLINELRQDKYNKPFTTESLEADLNNIESALRGDVHKLEKLKVEYAELDKKADKRPPTVQGFIRALNQYNSAFGTKYSIYDDNLYVIVYYTMMSELQDHYRTLNSKADNGRTNDR